MRFKLGLKTIAVPLALLCMAVPVITAMILVHRQAEHARDRLILQYARDALGRLEQTAVQLTAIRDKLNALPSSHHCDDTELELMRALDLNSTLLQAVGFVKDDTLRCSSFSARQFIPLGKPAIVSAHGVKIWVDVPISGSQRNFIVFDMNGAAGIVHRDLALSFVSRTPGLALAAFNWSHKVPLAVRGDVDFRFLRHDLPPGKVYREKGYLVAVVRSSRYDIGAIATIPLKRTAGLEAEAALILLPIGLVTGVVFAVLMVYVIRSRLSLPSLIQQGLRRNEFSLVFQPGVNLATGAIIAAEVLMRWERPDGETVPPDVFVAAAEDAGMIRQLTARVIELLSTNEDLRALPNDFPLAINLAADDLHTPATVDMLRQYLTRPGPGSRKLIVEATERSFVDAEQSRPVIEQLRGLGVRIAMDDFGTGYCSLGYLAKLKVDVIKIDKLFVKALGTDSPTSSVAAHIIEIAQDLHLRTIAEGIETQEQAELLLRLGVNVGQGWLCGPPTSAADLAARARAEWQPAPPEPEPVQANENV